MVAVAVLMSMSKELPSSRRKRPTEVMSKRSGDEERKGLTGVSFVVVSGPWQRQRSLLKISK